MSRHVKQTMTVAGLACAVVLGVTSSGAAASPARVLDPGERVTRSGHLQGVSVSGFVIAPSRADGPDGCVPGACDVFRVRLRLPRGVSYGDLAAVASAPTRSAGLVVRIFTPNGVLVADSSGGGVGAPSGTVSSYAHAPRLKAGTYVVRLDLSVGVADFVEQVRWRALG